MNMSEYFTGCKEGLVSVYVKISVLPPFLARKNEKKLELKNNAKKFYYILFSDQAPPLVLLFDNSD